jgi:hypothetical protein
MTDIDKLSGTELLKAVAEEVMGAKEVFFRGQGQRKGAVAMKTWAELFFYLPAKKNKRDRRRELGRCGGCGKKRWDCRCALRRFLSPMAREDVPTQAHGDEADPAAFDDNGKMIGVQ